MPETADLSALLGQPDALFFDGAWQTPSTSETITVLDSTTETPFLTVAAAGPDDMAAAVESARRAFDEGPWPRLTPSERATYLRKIGAGLRKYSSEVGQIYPREAGILHPIATMMVEGIAQDFENYGDIADTFEFVRPTTPAAGEYGVVRMEPVGVVGAIVAWNGPLTLAVHKLGPALAAGCTVILKLPPEAPGQGYVLARIADEIGLPPGVLNVVTADREVSEQLVRDPRVDKISFTGSTVIGRRIASICGDRIARYTLELGGKSAAIVLEDADIAQTAALLAGAECMLAGQICSSLTRIVVSKSRHDEMVEALAANFAQVAVGNPFDEATQMGPLVSERQRGRVEEYIALGVSEGAQLAGGGGRPAHLERGYFVEPTVFGHVDQNSRLAQEEIFGPVLSVIAADDDAHAVEIANNSIYGLNGAVFTPDVDRAYAVATQVRTGTVGHNAFRSDFTMGFGGFKQSGVGREGGVPGLQAYLEQKSVILDAAPTKL